VPLQKILEGLPLELQLGSDMPMLAMRRFPFRSKKVLSQLSRGAVKLSLENCARQRPESSLQKLTATAC